MSFKYRNGMLTATIDPLVVSGPPINVSATVVGASAVIISFQLPEFRGISSNCIFIVSAVNPDGSNPRISSTQNFSEIVQSLTITGVSPSATIPINVWQQNITGQGVASSLTVTTSSFSQDRGLFGGGRTSTSPSVQVNTIEYITITTTGNSTDFGDLTRSNSFLASVSSTLRGVFGGGGLLPSEVNIIDYVSFATTGNASDFGDLTLSRNSLAGCSGGNGRGVFAGGNIAPSPTKTNVIDYIYIPSLGNAVDFGDLSTTRDNLAGCSSATRGLFGGGSNPPGNTSLIQYITFSTTGNALTFGNLINVTTALAACNSDTRGIFAGGVSNQNVISYVTISTTGDSLDFGDLLSSVNNFAGCSNSTTGVFGGGSTPSGISNVIQYITIGTLGNAIDFGDLLSATRELAACSSSNPSNI